MENKVVLIDGLGETSFYGNMLGGDFHINVLLDIVKSKYSDVDYLKGLNPRHSPEVVSYFLCELGNIVVLNITKDANKYGKSAMIMLPCELSEKQESSLLEFCNTIESFSVFLLYDLEIVDGLLFNKQLFSTMDESPSILVSKYLSKSLVK